MKHQSYIRSLFVAFCAFFVCASAMAGELNPFAFKLSKTFKSDTLVVTYYLNAPATNVDIIVDLGNDKKFTENCNDKLSTQKQTLKKGIYVVDIPLRPHLNDATMGVLLRNKNSLQWSIKVTGGNTAEYRTCGQNGGNFTTLTPTKMTCKKCAHTYESYVIYDPMTCPKCGYNAVYYKSADIKENLISE